MRFSASEGVFLSDGTRLENATWRTVRFVFRDKATKKQIATANRIVAAIRAAPGKRWSAMEYAAWLDNAIGTDEFDGGVLLLVLAEFDVLVRSARAKNASDARAKYTEEQRIDYRNRAKSFDRRLSARAVATRLELELGIPAETGRGWLKMKK